MSDQNLQIRQTTPPSRMTVVETVYHQPAGGQPTESSSRFSRTLSTDEQPYSRRLTIPTGWVRLDPGWLGGVGVGAISLANEGPVRAVTPTPAERAADESLVIELAVGVVTDKVTDPVVAPFARVRPGESLRYEPVGVGRLFLRCAGAGPTRVLITLYPV